MAKIDELVRVVTELSASINEIPSLIEAETQEIDSAIEAMRKEKGLDDALLDGPIAMLEDAKARLAGAADRVRGMGEALEEPNTGETPDEPEVNPPMR